MELLFRLELFSLVAIFPYLLGSQLDEEFTIKKYTNSLPDDLKPIVQKALKLEKLQKYNDCKSEPKITCPAKKFRDPTGKCNNVRYPKWGNRGQKFLRFLRPNYVDGISRPRQSPTAQELPSPLDVAAIFQRQPGTNHESVTALLGSWTELLLHDLSSTGNLKSQGCCTDPVHNECYGYIRRGKCKEYMRTLPAVDMDSCTLEYRDQMNLATSFLDGSAIYGNTETELKRIRTYELGQINISTCSACDLNSLYSIFFKEHNRVALQLKKLNKQWTDETLFYESRRIVAAEIQHITYSEYLPLLLGEETMIKSQLELQAHGRYSKYSSAKRAGVYNEIATAVLPILLSLSPLINKSSDSLTDQIKTLISNPAEAPNTHIDLPVRSDWDSFALFLHMGRDHGIPAYLKYAGLCTNETVEIYLNFKELQRFGLNKSDIKLLKSLYGVATDIDLILGGVLEEPVPGALFGPTFNCLLKQQFSLLKESDRFWYENDLPPSSFTASQIKQIKRVTMASLICANINNVTRIQPKAFVQEDPYLNSKISCKQIEQPQFSEWQEELLELTEDIFKDALVKAEEDLVKRRKFEYKVWAEVGGVNPKSPQGTAVAFSKASKDALKLSNTSLLFELASNEIINTVMHNHRKKRHLFNDEDVPFFRNDITNSLQHLDTNNFFPGFNLNHFEQHFDCDETNPCDPSSPFRSYTGHCNNLRKPSWGKSLAIFSRLLPSVYEDGISQARVTGVTGLPLPNPRIISRIIHPDISNLHSKYTLMLMQFAQLLDHDLTLTPIHKGFEESIPDCRSCDSKFTVHPECDPLPIPPGDDYYPEYNVTTGEKMCLHSMRSLPGQQNFGPREQINMNSAYLDGSMIYGENPCKAKELKGPQGLMNFTTHPIRGKALLPQTHKHPECRSPSGLCFDAGDPRASEQPALTAIHTIFMREHNRLSDMLSKLNSHWSEEQIFEHVRRIVIAEFQHITYNEFLPRILGWNAMNLYELKLLPYGFYREYDPTCNPSIFNEFAAAAFRIGHSLLRPHIPRVSPNYEFLNPPILLRDGFFKVDMMMRENMVDEITRGLISTPIETLDQFITGEVTNHLFEDRRIPFSGIDLISRNLQRARDHGIPSYNNYRVLCNLRRAHTFEDLHREMSLESINRLKSVYAHVDDIDLFPGGMSERALKGGMIGPTFGCIIALQFKQLRKCDRFWYESDDPVVKFSEHQLSEIRKITLSKILCDNMDIDALVQRDSFELPTNFLNPRVPCHSLPSINLHAWKEFGGDQGCIIGDKYVRVGDSNFPTPCTSCVCTPHGANCASIKVNDCHKLQRFWSREAILKDEVCTAQCGFLLRDSPHTSFQTITHHNNKNFGNNHGLFGPESIDDFTLADLAHIFDK